jgi:Spy/CpxP family protein refolding chaperone
MKAYEGNDMKQLFNKTKLIGFALAAVLSGASAMTLAGPHCKDNDKQYPMERVLKKLDLSEAQQTELEAILAAARADRMANKAGPKMHALMHLDPEASDYLKQVEAHATTASENMKAKMLKMAKTRQQIHAILTDEQKQALKVLMEKKAERMEKKAERMEKRFEES